MTEAQRAACTDFDAGSADVPDFDFDFWSHERQDSVERALSDWVAHDSHGAPARLCDAMRYAVLEGGKRLRPLLLLGASEAAGGEPAATALATCATRPFTSIQCRGAFSPASFMVATA